MERYQMPAARRLDSLKKQAAERLATVQRCHNAESAYRKEVEAAPTWRDLPRYPKPFGKPGTAWQDCDKMTRADEREFYCDSFDVLGLREITKIDRRDGWPCGYYVNDFGDTVSGHVFTLPHGRFFPALSWSNADGVTLRPLDVYDSPDAAANEAERWCERVGEQERSYSRAWQAGQAAREALEELGERRANVLHALGDAGPQARAMLLTSYVDTREEAWQRVRNLWNESGAEYEPDAWADGSAGLAL